MWRIPNPAAGFNQKNGAQKNFLKKSSVCLLLCWSCLTSAWLHPLWQCPVRMGTFPCPMKPSWQHPPHSLGFTSLIFKPSNPHLSLQLLPSPPLPIITYFSCLQVPVPSRPSSSSPCCTEEHFVSSAGKTKLILFQRVAKSIRLAVRESFLNCWIEVLTEFAITEKLPAMQILHQELISCCVWFARRQFKNEFYLQKKS